MFNQDFFPTPPNLISKLLDKISWNKVTTVLEPSAGKGDLVDEIVERILNNQYTINKYTTESEVEKKRDKVKKKIDCIELDNNLKYILTAKGYKVIHNDFLTYNGMKRYSTIIANFPFSSGDKHLTQALNLIENNSGQLVCLINANTLRNAYTNSRKTLLQKLEDLNAKIEYLENEFTNAERKTGVTVALISVIVDKPLERESIIIENLKQKERYRKEIHNEQNSIVDGDFIIGIIQQYDFEIKAGIELINEYNKIKPLMLKTFNHNKNESILRLSINEYNALRDNYEPFRTEMINDYIKCVRHKYWDALFNSKEFTSMLTTNLKNDLINKIQELEDYDFSFYNIKEIQMQMNNNIIKGVEDTILDLFEEFSNKHSYEDFSKNIHLFNGWKSNSCWKINKRIVTTINGYYDMSHSWGSYDPIRIISKITDIEKAFNYLDGGKTEKIDLRQVLEVAKKDKITTNIDTKFFKLTFYKKGTCHILFKNEELLKKFNLFGCMKKGFLPPSYGKAKYEDMTKEEKSVIDNFEGKEEYNKVMKNLDYYIYNPSNVLMIEG